MRHSASMSLINSHPNFLGKNWPRDQSVQFDIWSWLTGVTDIAISCYIPILYNCLLQLYKLLFFRWIEVGCKEVEFRTETAYLVLSHLNIIGSRRL